MCTTTSVSAVAVPLNDGVVALEGDSGCSNVTAGDLVTTSKVIAALVPGWLPSPLGSLARAVYSPSVRPGLTSADSHEPALTVPLTTATSVPLALAPLYTRTVTSPASLAVPLKRGAVTFDGDANWLSVTCGGSVLTTKVTGSLDPGPLPSALFCTATAVYSPLVKAVPAAPEDQGPATDGCATAVETGLPDTVGPT